MNKHLLMIALLLTMPAFGAAKSNRSSRLAGIREQAKQTLGTCQARVSSLEQKIAAKERQIKALQARLSRMSGQSEFADEINNTNEGVRKAISEREALISQRGSAVGELNQNIKQYGRQCHINYDSQNGCCTVVAPNEYQYKNVQTSYGY